MSASIDEQSFLAGDNKPAERDVASFDDVVRDYLADNPTAGA